MASLFNVPNKTTLLALGNHSPGEVAYCEEEQEYYIYKNNEWQLTEFKQTNQDITMSAYEINKQIYNQMKPIEDLSELVKTLDNIGQSSDYWMLLGREIGYYTIFKYRHDWQESLSDNVIGCILDLAVEIKGIEYIDDGKAIEIWIKLEDGTITVLYFFNYEGGIVYYG